LEKIAYNAQPATFTKDMWGHQYDQQPNQVQVSLEKRNWTTNGDESNLFGVEPNFGCCTANMHQGWPKFVASLWMATPDDGLAAIAYGPNEVTSVVKNGVAVTIREETEYPFRGDVRLTVNPASATEFPLVLRIPAWAENSKITVNGKEVVGVRAGEYHRIERTWKKGDRVVLTMPMPVRTETAFNNGVVVERGPLVFSLKIGEKWTKVEKGMTKPSAAPAADWAVEPTTPWNYGLILLPDSFSKSAQVIDKKIGEYPFSAEGAPVEIRVKGRRIPDWKLVDGSAGTVPASPVASAEAVETITLIPYGSAKLRVTVFPRLTE
jgi:hypothetical protein